MEKGTQVFMVEMPIGLKVKRRKPGSKKSKTEYHAEAQVYEVYIYNKSTTGKDGYEFVAIPKTEDNPYD